MEKLVNLPSGFFAGLKQIDRIDLAQATILGFEEKLPDDLFKGLTTLTDLHMSQGQFQTLPNLDDLTAVRLFTAYSGRIHIDGQQNDIKFAGFASVKNLNLDGNHLTRIPSLTKMKSLASLWLADNRITTILPGDFKGPDQLVVLALGNNRIVSAAAEAFTDIPKFRFKPEDFDATNLDGTVYRDTYGIGIHTPIAGGYFGGGQAWSQPPISFSPNPVQCVWIGPFISDFDCDHCGIGYEVTSQEDPTCIKPPFRTFRGWAGSDAKTQLLLQDTRGVAIPRDDATNYLTLVTEHTYTIPAPKLLEQKDTLFVGYEQPFSQIKYEIDFSRGAEVDIGCDTSVVGNGAADPDISKDRFTHPASMQSINFQWIDGRANLVDPKNLDYGYYPLRCPRYHRFKVTKPGNFTIVSRTDFPPEFLHCVSVSSSSCCWLACRACDDCLPACCHRY